jgi:signal transduction histidine kinase
LSDWLPPTLFPWRAAAREKGLEWKTDIPSDLPSLELDPDRIAQALGNLLSNAIKYTPQGGEVSVRAAANKHEVWIGVSDTGPGILPEEHQRVFEPFYRSDHERRFPQGLGLGLTIARDLVEAHGGKLDVASTPGKGCTFTICLPVQDTSLTGT